jgi:hypothetical protein
VSVIVCLLSTHSMLVTIHSTSTAAGCWLGLAAHRSWRLGHSRKPLFVPAFFIARPRSQCSVAVSEWYVLNDRRHSEDNMSYLLSL